MLRVLPLLLAAQLAPGMPELGLVLIPTGYDNTVIAIRIATSP
jgi:hypothetical protein